MTIQPGAEVTFRAPLIRLGAGFRTIANARFQARSGPVTCADGSTAWQ